MADNVDYDQVERAVKALQAYIDASRDSSDLIPDEKEAIIWMILTTRKFSETAKAKPYRIPLKHSIIAPDAEVCLITKDPQATYKELLKEKDVKHISKVIGVSKLREKFRTFEAKRKLCASYDLFLADDRVLPLLPKILGKTFFEKKKQPIPVNFAATNLKGEIERAIFQSTYMFLNSGTGMAVKIGTTAHSSSQVRENIEMALPAVVEKIPKKWRNLQAVHIKTAKSTSLPVFNSLRLPNLPREGTGQDRERGKEQGEKKEKLEVMEMDSDDE
jgi:ribosome biogenesis protein UTP30